MVLTGSQLDCHIAIVKQFKSKKTLWLKPNLLMTPISPHFVNQISSFIYFEVPDSGKWQRMPDDDKDCDNDESIFTSKTTFCLLRSVTKLWLDWMSCTLATLKLNLSLSLCLSFSLFLSLSLFFQHVDSSPRNATTAFKNVLFWCKRCAANFDFS